jgi:tRNA-dihydrouridine synthase A
MRAFTVCYRKVSSFPLQVLSQNGNRFRKSSSISLKDNFRDRFSVAPMMDYTDRHQRYFQRLITKKAVLYTEMITAPAINNCDNLERLLRADFSIEEPVVLQLGGADPAAMGKAASLAYRYGYRNFNLNIGCPSDRVADAGCFGAALMARPALVSDLALAIRENTDSECDVTVKCRLGINDEESYEYIHSFIDKISSKAKVNHFIVHARNAILGKKFTPEDNRKIPPLKYDYVYRLVKDYPELTFSLNGGIKNLEECSAKLSPSDKSDNNGTSSSSNSSLVHGIMVGRNVISDPFHWRKVDSSLYGCPDPGKRELFFLLVFLLFILTLICYFFL